MKNWSIRLMALIIVALPVCFSACTRDNCSGKFTYVYYEPVFKPKDEVRGNIRSNAPRQIVNPGKICLFGNTIFLNEKDKGIHVIDNSDPSHPQRVSFIDIPGNLDIAVKGNFLYADMYTDLITLDITSPFNVKVTAIVDSLFPYRNWGNFFVSVSQDKVVVDWIRKDSTVYQECDASRNFPSWGPFRNNPIFFAASSSSPLTSVSPVGIGGSMARFTIMNERLYTVSSSQLRIYNISTPEHPVFANKLNIGWNIETIYPFKNKLFIGSQTGMFIYDVANADAPSVLGQFNHVRSCDPVIADDEYAYVTLRSGNICAGFVNELDIVRLNNFTNPTLEKVYQMTNPHGLSKDGNLLFICDGKDGLKIFNASIVMDLKPIKTINNLDAYDVIAHNKIALVAGKDGIYQYTYANPNNIRLLSKITVTKN